MPSDVIVADVYDAATREPIGFVISSPDTFKSYGPDGQPDGGHTVGLLASYAHDYRALNHKDFFEKNKSFAEVLHVALLNGPAVHRKIEVHVRDQSAV